MRAVEVLQAIVDVTREIDEARAALHRGHDVALEGLDGRVRELCLSTTELPKAEGLACAGALDGVAQALERLRGTLALASRVAGAAAAASYGQQGNPR
ncbi:MAG: hypothetical protein HY059_14460 [Proteobacteria bacterium]|nr:hypothetical protein [Pseudomonadota bacterium]